MRRLGRPNSDADRGSDEAREQEDEDYAEIGERGGELVARVGADRHEPAGAERQLAAIADQEIEAERRHAEDQERDQYGVEPVVAEERGRHDVGGEHDQDDEDAVLDDRKHRLVGGVSWS